VRAVDWRGPCRAGGRPAGLDLGAVLVAEVVDVLAALDRGDNLVVDLRVGLCQDGQAESREVAERGGGPTLDCIAAALWRMPLDWGASGWGRSGAALRAARKLRASVSFSSAVSLAIRCGSWSFSSCRGWKRRRRRRGGGSVDGRRGGRRQAASGGAHLVSVRDEGLGGLDEDLVVGLV
jgi:hypothetical protein